MALLTLWPYLLMIPALLIGIAIGCFLPKPKGRFLGIFLFPTNEEPESAPEICQKEFPNVSLPMQISKEELSDIDDQLVSMNEKVALKRQRLEELEAEYERYLLAIDSRLADISEVNKEFMDVSREKQTNQAQIIASIDASGEEYEMLKQLDENYTVRINRLAQQVQRQDSELQMLRQTARAKTAEINETEALILQREQELRRLFRKRRQLDVDINRARKQLSRQHDELRQVLESQKHDGITANFSPTQETETGSRKDVTPLNRLRLSSGD